MSDETYNGWLNRETWAFDLHWSNDQGLYNETLEVAGQYLRDTYGHAWPGLPADELRAAMWGVGDHVIGYWRREIDGWVAEFGEPVPEVLAMFRDEVGSWWRVDAAEVGASVLESLGVEATCPDCGGTGAVPISGGEAEGESDNGYKACPTCNMTRRDGGR